MNKPAARMIAESSAGARFTTAEFMLMAASGAFDNMKIELVDGELERMTPPMREHARRQMMVAFRLNEATTASELVVLGETGIDLDDDTVLACDVALVRPAPPENRLVRAKEIVLAVEIAESTVVRDLGFKRAAYASAGIAHYWVVDGERAIVHVFAAPVNGQYTEGSIVRFGEPLAVPGTDRTIMLD